MIFLDESRDDSSRMNKKFYTGLLDEYLDKKT